VFFYKKFTDKGGGIIVKTYTYSQARARLAEVLEESKKGEVVVRRRKGDLFSIAPKTAVRRSPFDVAGLDTGISRQEILAALRDSRAGKR
jgi:hypothetical protein